MKKHNHKLPAANSTSKSRFISKLKFSAPRTGSQAVIIFLCLFALAGGLFFYSLSGSQAVTVSAAESDTEIEEASFVRQEFFGAEAIVPLPTAEARKNLAELAENSPDNPQILEKLAESNEKLGLFDEAEKNWLRLCELEPANLEKLAAYYERRAEFAKEAEIFRKILFSAAAEKRPNIFEQLIYLARIHELEKYLSADFYAEVARENPNFYPIFEKLIDNLMEEKNYAAALDFTRRAKAQFPARQDVLLKKEVDILLAMDKVAEAETVYRAAFDPLWSEDEAQKFYDFLSERDHLRLYGAEIKAKFRKDPADFDAGLRLALYQNHDYSYGNDSLLPVISKMEQAKKSWTVSELATISRLLLKENETAEASRFLYTLYAREDFQSDTELRAQVLYQIFEMFCQADNQKLPISKGDLRFYEDVAKTDTDPGIATGILSLIFSDTHPGKELDAQEVKATKYFNRAAAYKIFEEYKKENPQSPELAQMSLDLVQIYTVAKKPEIAEKLLDEFAASYENSKDFADAALKLAEAFVVIGKPQKAREIYQKTLDYLGKNHQGALNSEAEEIDTPSAENQPAESAPTTTYSQSYSDQERKKIVFRDYLGEEKSNVTYANILEQLIASLAGEKKTTEILAVYSNEIAKYPDEQWLYEQRLHWLEQTNMVEDQLAVYKEAARRFQTSGWRSKLARFFIRQNRDREFAEFSDELIEKLNNQETQSYLSEFVDGKISASAFDSQIYFKLYQSAHSRFPHNITFVNGLLRYYTLRGDETQWRVLAAEYYFESSAIRELFLDKLAKTGSLRQSLAQSAGRQETIYELFRADASVRLSDYENAVEAYRKLNQMYPNNPEFSGRLIDFTRSFGQKNPEVLSEAAYLSKAAADFQPSSAALRTQSGEISAELGDYPKSCEEWSKLIQTASGNQEIYLETATVYWDYYQYADALQTIRNLRSKLGDESLYAFETGALLEAQHRENQAIGEYVKALGTHGDDDAPQNKAIKRLRYLTANQTPEKSGQPQTGRTLQIIDAAFNSQKGRGENASYLTLGYANFLTKIKQIEKARTILDGAVQNSSDANFVKAAKDFYETENIRAGEQNALQRLSEISAGSRDKIEYALQTAESFEDAQNPNAAKNTISKLLHKFPTNYGVLTEASNFYWRLGYQAESAEILQNALPHSRGTYRNLLSSKLAGRLTSLQRPAAAEQILAELHRQNPADADVFRELVKICIQTGNVDLMRRSFAETLREMKKDDDGRGEFEGSVVDLRINMIDAFTRLKDYRSAVEQHIEIINREPENEELTENAVAYVKRYGGAETLTNYYLKLSAEAFKNYRWNVVLARIYEINGETEKAIQNYQTALINQPEMPELYQSIADLETKRGNYDAALKNMDEVLTLTNDAPENVKKKIEILQKAGRSAEIETEKAKLPVEAEKKTEPNDFAEAQKLAFTEKEKSRQLYREAFNKLLENPLNGELKASDLNGYISSVRTEEPLGQINEQLWELRGQLIEIADETDGKNAGEARKRLQILDSALTEALGSIAKNTGTDDELAVLHENWSRRIAEKSFASDTHQSTSLIQDLSRRAGFGDLEEIILRKRIDESIHNLDRQIYVRNLFNFYQERGTYQKAFDVLEQYGADSLSQKAEAARLAGNREKELEALRANYWKPSEKPLEAPSPETARYLDLLYAENREELKTLTEKSSAFQLQLINYLLSKGERELAHAAIKNSSFSDAWKASRSAEVSLALHEFEEPAECYFCDALQFDTIGNLIGQTPEKKRFLINDEWFQLTREYGEWLDGRHDKTFSPAKYLSAMTENLPHDADEQFKLGEYYLQKKELKPAIERIKLAIAVDNGVIEDKTKLAALTAAYYLVDKKDYAEECRRRLFEDGDEGVDNQIQRALIYADTLQKYGLNAKSREMLPPVIVEFLKNNDADRSEDFQKLIRAVAASFTDESEKAAYFQTILNSRLTDSSLAEMLLNENLIDARHADFFYQRLIARHHPELYNYEYTSIFARAWGNTNAAESLYALENNDLRDAGDDEGEQWRKKYLELLLQNKNEAQAGRLIAAIETEIRGRQPRPGWLRAAKFRLEIRVGRINLADLMQFTGISSEDSATEIKPPDLERFNQILQILRDENRAEAAPLLSEAFFGRMLALGQYEEVNFDGLARAFFQKGEPEKALTVLRLMVKAGDQSQKETALAEIAALDAVKARAADAAKVTAPESNAIGYADALKGAAEISEEFGQTAQSVDFRRELSAFAPQNTANKLDLARLLIELDSAAEASQILNEIIGAPDTLRPARWQARAILRDTGDSSQIPNIPFDAFSQFYLGIGNNSQPDAAEFFINSLIADQTAGLPAREALIESYALSDKPYAALKLAETGQSQKSAELWRLLSIAAEKTGDFAKALEFEKAKPAPDETRIDLLQKLAARQNSRATELTVTPDNTRKL